MNALRKAPRIDGAKIAVVVESKFIAEEIWGYLSGFPLLGAEVDLISRIWYGDYKPAVATFYSDSDPTDEPPWTSPQKVEVRRDISQVRPGDYAAVIMSANYTSVRLRYPGELPDDLAQFDPWAHVQAAPVVRFFAEAMQSKQVVKGLLCHGLWVLAPNPKLLRGRKVICHSVVMADIINCGAVITVTPDRVVTDDDLVTGFSKHQVVPFIAAIAEQISRRRSSPP
jgi:protease I